MAPKALTPIRLRMLKLLSDGEAHKRAELTACLDDDLAEWSAVKAHLWRLRNHYLRERGYELVCEYRNQTLFYRIIKPAPHSFPELARPK